jgi:hypothetical protein
LPTRACQTTPSWRQGVTAVRGHAELGEDVLEVACDGLDVLLVGDLANALAGGDQPQDRPRGVSPLVPAFRRGCGALRLIRRPQLLEDGERAADH